MAQSKKLARLAAVFLFSLASHVFGLRAPLLDYHYHRQCNTAAIARNYHENGLKFFHPRIDWQGSYNGRAATEFPFYMWLTGMMWPVGGLGEMWGRILSVLFSALAAVYLVLFLRTKLEENESFYAGLLFSCVPLEIYFGRTVQPEAMALLSTIAAFYHWQRFLQNKKFGAHWALGIGFAFLAVAHKLPYIYLLGPMAYAAWKNHSRDAWGKLPAALAFPLILGGVWSWYHYAGKGTYVVPVRLSEVIGILNYDRLPYYMQFQVFSRFPELVTTYGGLVLFALGVRALYKKGGGEFFGVWFAAILAALAVGGGYSFYHEYSSLPLALPAAALMGLGLASLLDICRAQPRAWKLALVALLVASMPVHAAWRIGHWYRINYPKLPGARQAADSVSAPGDLFICNERASSTILYYLHRKGWSWDIVEMGPERLGMIEEKIAQGARFYAACKNGVFKDKNNGFARYFHSRYPVVYDADDLVIFRLRPQSAGSRLPRP